MEAAEPQPSCQWEELRDRPALDVRIRRAVEESTLEAVRNATSFLAGPGNLAPQILHAWACSHRLTLPLLMAPTKETTAAASRAATAMEPAPTRPLRIMETRSKITAATAEDRERRERTTEATATVLTRPAHECS